MKKMTSVLVAILMVLNFFAGSFPVKAAAAETIAAWDYTAAPPSAVVPATSGYFKAGAELTNFKSVVPTYSTSSLSVSGWDNGAGSKYWQLSLSTKGFDNISLSAKTRSSGTGPRDFKVAFSVDNGTTWSDVSNSTYSITGTALSNYMPTLSLPAGAADVEKLLVRFIMTSNISSRAGTSTYSPTETVASGGTSNINNIFVTGTPVTNDTTVRGITASPERGSETALGSKVALSCETEGATIMYSLNGGEFTAYDPAAQVTLTSLPATIKAYGKKEGLDNSVTSTFNYTQGKVASVTASPNGGAVILNKLVTLSCTTPNSVIKYSLDSGATWNDYTKQIQLTTLPTEIKAYAKAEGLLDSAVSTFGFTQRVNVDYNIYFGQLHSHTNYSDGIGTVEDAYSYAKNTAKVDFLAVTDHSNSFDNANISTMADGSASTEWSGGHAAADIYTDTSFVGIYAYEMTWSNGTGHINTFNTPGFENRDAKDANKLSIYGGSDGLKKYYDVLKQYPDSVSQFNHPGPNFGDFEDFAYYDPQIDKQISLIEVGNGEGAVGSGGYFPSYEYYTRALDKGWHVSPTNNQDNHLGKWGDANTARTVVLADSLTRSNIYDAMRNMRTYATEDNNLRIKYTLNGEVMGTIYDAKPDGVAIKVELEDPDGEALGKVSVIANGGIVAATKTLATSKDTVEFTLNPDYSYYYIRIDEADKDIAVTAPVWLGEVDKAGIAKTTGSTTLPIKGESFTITTSFFNNEAVPMYINRLVYSIDGAVINTATNLTPVNSLGTGSYSFDYTPSVAGKYNIDVKMTATIKGVEKVFTDVLKLDVTHPDIVTKVVVDASHYNDYVNGYYSGNMTNLITLANGERINVILEKNKLTDEVLKDTQLLILSPPAKKNGTANNLPYPESPYTEDEIAAIARYAENGGNIIVTGLADYQDSRTVLENHTAYQQNLILKAIGAESRINDDEVIDYDNNPNVTPPGVAGGTPYRVPMNSYNMSSPYLNGVVPEQNYSFYSGCSITPGSNATWLVRGTPTTYGFDSDNDKLGGSYVSAANKTIPADTGIGKGNVVALATETLPGGGKLFIGGTVFYSNFEVKAQLDNATQLQNSNYNITMNILDSIKRVIPVTPIGEVRTAQMGDAFCVEGIVTAGKTPSDNAFFDTLYIQDATGGINLFPVADANIKVGQRLKAIGYLDQYQGDLELRVLEYSVTDTSVNPVEPAKVTTNEAMESINGGSLLRIEGIVTRMDSQNIYVDDGSGEARAFVDGYIGDGSGDPSKTGKWDPRIRVGEKVNITGLASIDPIGPRLRVRNTAEIVWIPDTITPVITIDGVTDGDVLRLNQERIVTWSVSDDWTGVKAFEGDITSGTLLDTSTVGAHTLNFMAVDDSGNKTTKKITYYVHYDYSGVFGPFLNDGETAINAGSTIPVKFQLKDANGSFVTDAKAKLYYAKINDVMVGTEFEALSTSNDSNENIFRYDAASNQYIFNFKTKDLAAGTYRLRIDLGDGSENTIKITLK